MSLSKVEVALLCTVALTALSEAIVSLSSDPVFSPLNHFYSQEVFKIAILLFMPRSKNRHSANTHTVFNTSIQEFSDLAHCKNE